MNDDPLQRAATLDRLQFLRDRGALSAEQHRAGAWWVAGPPKATTWRRLLDVVALVLGASLIVSGLVYVLVWNWTALGRLTQIPLASLPVLAAAAVALFRGTDSLTGKVAASAGAVLIFAPLMVLGLSYSSGGDPWPLLALWTVLCVPWAVAARFAPAWFVVLFAADATVLSAFAELEGPNELISVYAVLAVHVVGWVGLEALRRASVPWANAWSCHLLLVPVQTLMASVTVWWVGGWVSDLPVIAIAVVFLVSSLVVQGAFMARRLHPFVAVVNVVALVTVAVAVLGRLLDLIAWSEDMEILLALPFGFLMLLSLGLAGAWIGVGLRRRVEAS